MENLAAKARKLTRPTLGSGDDAPGRRAPRPRVTAAPGRPTPPPNGQITPQRPSTPPPAIPDPGEYSPDTCNSYWGCKDTVGISQSVAAGAVVEIEVTAPKSGIPVAFHFEGTSGDFRFRPLRAGNSQLTHTGGRMNADAYGTGSRMDKRVNWPPFDGNTPLVLEVENVDAAPQTFRGTLFIKSLH